jgi:hypothetical protein
MDGSLIFMNGNAAGAFALQTVSPTVTAGHPEMQTMSPPAVRPIGTLFTATNSNNCVILNFSRIFSSW